MSIFSLNGLQERTRLIFSCEEIHAINTATVLVVGIGGVGGIACEILVRMGVKKIILIDSDVIHLSNLNRQIITHSQNISRSKVEVAQERLLQINPLIEIITIREFLHKENIYALLSSFSIDFILDAIDSVGSKAHLIAYAKNNNIAIVTALGAAQRRNPEDFIIIDLFKTYQDPLARALRLALKKMGIKKEVKAIFNRSRPIKTKHDVPRQLGHKFLGSYVSCVMVAGSLLAHAGIELFLRERCNGNNR